MPTRRVTFRLYPTPAQEQKLRWARAMHKDLFNSALVNRKTQYQKFGNKVNYYQQQGSLPAYGSSSTSSPKGRKSCGGMKQLAQKKRQKSERTVVDDGDGVAPNPPLLR